MTPRAGAIGVAFVANGMGGPSFLPRLPERQDALGLSDAGLGLVLVGMAAGALAASPLAGRAVGRVGSRPVVVAAALALAASLWTAGAAPEPVLLFAALAVIGAADAAMDIAMNANGSAYERGTGRSILHRLHGAWSLGALAGAGLAAAAAGAGVPLTWQLAAVGAVIAAGVLTTRSGLVATDAAGVTGREPADPASLTGTTPPDGRQTTPNAGQTERRQVRADGVASAATGTAGDGRRRRRRPAAGPLVVLGAATIGGAMIEGAPADWSAIRLERLGAGPGVAALGFAAFMAGMLAGRLVGDHLTDRFGGAAVLRGGMALVAGGLLAGVVVDQPAVFAVGLVLAGVGASGFFPLAFSAAGNTPGVAPGAGAATVSLTARLGFLVEPLAMGAMAELMGLRWAFVAVAGVAVALAVAATRIVRPSVRGAPPAAVTDVRAC
jgi:MFS family permease